MMPNMSTRAEPRLDKPKLVYPFESVPGPAEAMPVAPGVMWLRMPMPMQLDHINLWAIEDGNSWAVVDTGMRTDQTLVAWRQLLSKGTDGRRVGRVFATHMHPDHVGMAGWLTRKFDCALWMTRTEYLNCRVLAADTGREAPAEAIRFYRRAGWATPRSKTTARASASSASSSTRCPTATSGWRTASASASARMSGRWWAATATRPSIPACTALLSSC